MKLSLQVTTETPARTDTCARRVTLLFCAGLVCVCLRKALWLSGAICFRLSCAKAIAGNDCVDDVLYFFLGVAWRLPREGSSERSFAFLHTGHKAPAAAFPGGKRLGQLLQVSSPPHLPQLHAAIFLLWYLELRGRGVLPQMAHGG